MTVNVDEDLKKRMNRHPEINWREVTGQAIREKIEGLEVMDELTSESELTEKINKSGRKRVEENLEWNQRMKLVIDANAVISAHLADSKTRELIVTSNPTF